MDSSRLVWSQVFWIIFIILGVILILVSRFDAFLTGLFMGLVIIILGLQKIAEDRDFQHLYMRQKTVDKNLREMSSFIDRTYVPERSRGHAGLTIPELDKAKKEIESRMDSDMERLAKKMLEIENKVNQLSRSIVDNWGRMQEEQLLAQADAEEKQSKAKKSSDTVAKKGVRKANNELRKKLEKAIGS